MSGSLDPLAEYQRDGRAWVTTDGRWVYLLVRLVDGDAHVEQVSIRPQHSRRGLGRQLRDIVTGESERGLTRWSRVVQRRATRSRTG